MAILSRAMPLAPAIMFRGMAQQPRQRPVLPPPRFAALRIPAYRRYFSANLLSMTADNIEHVISYWVMFQAFHSPALAGFAVISHWVPFLLFSMHAGALADRYDCRKLIQISQGLFMVASLAWGRAVPHRHAPDVARRRHPPDTRRRGRRRCRPRRSSSSTTWCPARICQAPSG